MWRSNALRMMIQLTDWHSHTTFVKATKAIDIWSFGVILYALVTGAPLFDMNRDDDPKTAEAMKALYEWDEHKRLMRLEKVILDKPHSTQIPTRLWSPLFCHNPIQ